MFKIDAGTNGNLLAGNKAMEPTLVYGGSETYLHKVVRVLGWQKSGDVCDVLHKTLLRKGLTVGSQLVTANKASFYCPNAAASILSSS